ncbi:hypothetical protein BJ170DRAFT_595593 [Xylariales sp. AK1849]|nr:hypothetical protein BJ170DRAFT_595593 [Xylariales sp. AK1849]
MSHDPQSSPTLAASGTTVTPDTTSSPVNGGQHEPEDPNKHKAQESIGATFAGGIASGAARVTQYENGYHFPPKYSWKDTINQGLIDFWAFYNTGFGFFLTMYSLNVVAWGGMLFLLLCNAAPPSVMCYPDGDCNAIDAPRRVWIETDSQILNALFCVTGFGLAPWRFRDLYLLLKWRMGKDTKALREVAGVHRGWFRLPGSERLPVNIGTKNIEETIDRFPAESIPYPIETIPEAPPTGIRAPATTLWKLDFVIWFNVANTLLQVVLSSFMWALNRYDRPSWSTGLFVCLACIAAAVAGIMMGLEGKHVKAIEGVPLTKRDIERLRRDEELGVPHWNNLKDKDPQEKEKKKQAKKTASHDSEKTR